MSKQLSLPASLREMSTGKRLFFGILALIIAFLILGSLNQSTGSDDFSFGIQAQPFYILAILAFGGGLLSFASPCTLPVLTAYFAFAFQSGRRQIATNTLAFMLGLGTTFSLLGAVGFALGRVLRQNEQLLILIGGAFILLLGVMSFLGKGFSGIQQSGSDQQQNTTLKGSYVLGLSFAVGWSSCVGPILGAVFTLASQTTSVWNGMMLLFIYTLGLGLPLIIVSTFFGRMSRKSLFWRILRGKGWDWHAPTIAVALIWALAVWFILVAFGRFAFNKLPSLNPQDFGQVHVIGLLVLTVIGAVLWVYTGKHSSKMLVHLHSTQLVSGALFIAIGALMLAGKLATFNSLVPPDLALWFIELEEKFITLFN